MFWKISHKSPENNEDEDNRRLDYFCSRYLFKDLDSITINNTLIKWIESHVQDRHEICHEGTKYIR